jgi:DNA-binding NtrC family response regulator
MKKDGHILIVDDNEELLVAFRFYLGSYVERIETLKNPNLIPSELEKKQYDLILLDMNFGGGRSSGNEGLFWLRRILDSDPDATVLMITAYGDIDLAVKSLKEGAHDFIDKSWDEKKILATILSSLKFRRAKEENMRLKKQNIQLSSQLYGSSDYCKCQSRAMRKVYEIVEKVAKTQANILILGESGTGKELLAREIHKMSSRKNEIFVKVDLGSIPETLFESELFGHKAGAFTDAKTDREGRFEVANGGTLFLDEIGNLNLSLQSKLLSALQNKEVFRVGSSKPLKIDVRMICATNMSLENMVREKQFREDLFYRINSIQIDIPPLRERKEDIPLLAQFYFHRFVKHYNKPNLKLGNRSIDSLVKYEWPGNIRELSHVIEKGVILTDGDEILHSDFFPNLKDKPKQLISDNFSIEEHEKVLIAKALEYYRWNLTITAEKLGINRSTLYAKIGRYGLKQV